MAATLLLDDLESYIGQYGTHGAIQRLMFIAQKTDRKNLQIDANRMCLDLLKRTTNTKSYADVYSTLKDLLEGSEGALPQYDTVWIEATQKQASILKDVYEQDLHQSKITQIKETIRTCHNQLANFFTEAGDYASALKYVSKSREYCSDPAAVLSTCMTIIKLSALLRQYTDIQSFTSKARHSHFTEESDQSKIHAAYGLYYMATGKYKDAASSFAQVKQQDLVNPGLSGNTFNDILSAQDIALYGVLCALASLERNEVQSKLLDSPFRECLELVPQVQDLTLDFCNCKYAACLSALEKLKEPLSLDVHLHSQVNDICQQIRNKGMVQYFAPFLSVSLHSMATAFNTDVDGIQSEVASLITKKQLDAKIDSHKKVLHVRHANQRKQTYQNAMRVSQDFLDTTQALVLRMNLLKHDFGVHLARQKK
jgi:COP9 signalosome complex subunit 1